MTAAPSGVGRPWYIDAVSLKSNSKSRERRSIRNPERPRCGRLGKRPIIATPPALGRSRTVLPGCASISDTDSGWPKLSPQLDELVAHFGSGIVHYTAPLWQDRKLKTLLQVSSYQHMTADSTLVLH